MQNIYLEIFSKDQENLQLRFRNEEGELFSDSTLRKLEIEPLIRSAETGYRVTAADLDLQGKALFDLLDGPGGNLRKLQQQHEQMALHLDVEEGFRYPPWELLHDGKSFLCADSVRLFTPVRTAGKQSSGFQPRNRALRVLFMASSPENVEPVLAFEEEEGRILDATLHKVMELQVEESGSLEGLREQIEYFSEDHFDVFHLTGHADIYQGQPVFLLENPEGGLHRATAEDLSRVFTDIGRVPKLVFLSGCRTGQAVAGDNLASFSETMVRAGFPAVLGWALPVGDRTASDAAAWLYEKLAAGSAIHQAVAYTRQQLHQNQSGYWHLLRLYSNGNTLTQLVTAGRKKPVVNDPQTEFLDAGNKIEVCSRKSFVGRRRLLQRCLSVLKAFPGERHYAEGVLLYGMGGLGKSSAAARLLSRMQPSHQSVVCYGRLDETELVEILCDKVKGAGKELNRVEDTLKQRLKTFLSELEKPLLLIFDDFEQNVEDPRAAELRFTTDSTDTLQSLADAIHDSGSDSRIIVTCRYQVPLANPSRLHQETPETFRGADLKKKLRQLEGLSGESESEPELAAKMLELGAGNPRLLERLNRVIEDKSADLLAVIDRLQQTEAEFREEILIKTLLENQNSAVRKALALTALYQIPVNLDAVLALLEHGTDAEPSLKKAARTGLVEISGDGPDKHYYVSPLLHPMLKLELSEQEYRDALEKACAAFYAIYLNNENTNAAQEQESLRLALAAKNKEIALELGVRLSRQTLNRDLYLVTERICQNALALTYDFRLFSTLAKAELILGRQTAASHFEQAKELILELNSESRTQLKWDIAFSQFEYSDFLIRREQFSDALELLNLKVLPALIELGNVRERALTIGRIADILQAQGQLDEALRIRREEELPVYEQLGDVRSRAVTMGQIADILQVRGQLDEALSIRREEELPIYEQLGELRLRANTMGNIAGILQARGQLDEALRIRREEELPVYIQLGDVRSRAVTMGNIADILQKRGQLDEALRIRREEELPVYEELGVMRERAVAMGKIADILQKRGQLEEALRIRREEELPVFEQLGDVRELLVGRTNLALLLLNKEGKTAATEVNTLLYQALEDATLLQIPEAEIIAGILDKLGMNCSQ